MQLNFLQRLIFVDYLSAIYGIFTLPFLNLTSVDN